MTRRYLGAALAAGLLTAITGSTAIAQDKPPVVIGAIAPLTGPGAYDGQLTVEGMELMARLINDAGGVLGGRKIKLLTYDDQGLPAEGNSAAKRAIELDHVDLLIGGQYSAVALSMKEVTRDKIITMITTAQHPDVTNQGHKYLFRLSPQSIAMAGMYANFICTKMKFKSIAFFTVNDDYGRVEDTNYRRLLTDCGIEVKNTEYYNHEQTDFSVAVTTLKSLNTDAIKITANSMAQAGSIYRTIKQSGYKGKVIASAVAMTPKLIELAGASVEGVYSASLFTADSPNPSSQAWVKLYAAASKNEPNFNGAIGAEAVQLLAGAMNEAGDPRAYDKIAAALHAHAWPTLLGDITFDDKGQANQNVFLIQVQKGRIVRVAE